MLYQNVFKLESPNKMDSDHLRLSPDDEKSLHKPNFVQKPSNFSIDHILKSAGSTRDKYISECRNQTATELSKLNETSDHFLIDNNVHQYPPILNWLQYTRYKPPRLPSEYTLCMNSSIIYIQFNQRWIFTSKIKYQSIP